MDRSWGSRSRIGRGLRRYWSRSGRVGRQGLPGTRLVATSLERAQTRQSDHNQHLPPTPELRPGDSTPTTQTTESWPCKATRRSTCFRFIAWKAVRLHQQSTTWRHCSTHARQRPSFSLNPTGEPAVRPEEPNKALWQCQASLSGIRPHEPR